MKKTLVFFVCSLLISLGQTRADNDLLKLCSFNILYDKVGDPQASWESRKEMALDIINTYDFDLIGAQEVSQSILSDLKAIGRYEALGEGINGGVSGVQNTILYRKNRFELLASGIFWLSETPEKASLGWDAKNRRNCTWAKLKDNNTSKVFYYINTHFDHEGVVARNKSAIMMRDTISKMTEGYPTFFMGDLNCMEMEQPIMTLKEKLTDPRSVSLTPPLGAYGTGHGFRFDRNVRRIDWLMFTNGNGRSRVEVHKYEVINKVINGKSASDHWPVHVAVKLIDGSATLRVNSSADDNTAGTLRNVISQAEKGDSIVIEKNIGAIKLKSTINLIENISINGQGAIIQVENPGVSPFKTFSIGSNTITPDTVRIYNMELKGGQTTNGAVAIVNQYTHLVADNVTFSDGVSTSASGGLHVERANGVSLNLSNCLFENNSSKSNGGALYAKGELLMADCVFRNNRTESNGAAIASNAKAIIRNTLFQTNSAIGTGDYGGAIFNTSATGIMTIENCLFDTNIATDASKGAGAFGCSGGAKTLFSNSTFSGNAGAIAGVLYNRAGEVSLINCSVAGNVTGSSNGAFHIYDATNASANLVNSILAYNYNSTGRCDLSAGVNAEVKGDYNLISSSVGNFNFTNPITFLYGANSDDDTPLFADYGSANVGGQALKTPILADNGGRSYTLALHSTSIALNAGIASTIGLDIPKIDQRLYARNLTPSLGAYELTDCNVPASLSVQVNSAVDVKLSWSGASNSILQYKEIGSTSWNEAASVELNNDNVTLSNLHSSSAYNWRVRSACNQDWVYGQDFETPFGLIVRSGDDDGGKETLRYIIANASEGDSITLAVDVVKLAYILYIPKSITINGQGATIEPMIAGTGFGPFEIGSNNTTSNTVKFYDMKLIGGKSASGGIIFLNQYTKFYAEDVVFEGGVASEYSGAIHCNSATGTEVEMKNCTFLNNESVNNGGAVYSKGKLRLENCVFDSNKTASNGSALVNIGDAILSNCLFVDNIADGAGNYGSAIFSSNAGARIEINNTSFVSNINKNQTKGAGAFTVSGNSEAVLTNCTFWGNMGANASAIYGFSGKVALVNTTVTGNESYLASAGAVHLNSNTANAFTLVNSIFTHNYAQQLACDLSRSTNGSVKGTNNVVGTAIGTGYDYLNTINFDYMGGASSPLFFAYSNVNGNSIPDLSEGDMPFVRLSFPSLASAAGIAFFEGLTIPLKDQLGVDRGTPPCIGAYEIPKSVGIADVENRTSFKVYPNPVTEVLYIENENTIMSYEILTIIGHVIKKGVMEGTSINVQDLPSGIYILKAVTENGPETIQIKKN